MYGHERSLVNSMKGRPFTLLGVNNDQSLTVARNAVKKNQLNWRSWYDGKGGPIVRNFGIRSFPTIFLLDHEGVVRFKNIRGAALDSAIELLVSEAESAGMSGATVDTKEYRIFRTADGRHEVEAAYVGFKEGKVSLQRKDNGKVVEIPLNILAREDQQYIRALRQRR
ncbi:MAG: SHD1 domain-containing protein [Planctomycetota bacterium]|nr:SHD1 domain-containing protein [Planctomycetota bacterium]